MMRHSRLRLLQFVNSSLWITVLAVRVGCIIEAHPSPRNSNNDHEDGRTPSRLYNFYGDGGGEEYEDNVYGTELETAASQSFLTSPKNALYSRSGSGLSDYSSKKESSSSFHAGDGKTTSISTSTTAVKNVLLIMTETTPFPISSSNLGSLSQARSSKEPTPPVSSSPVVSSNKNGGSDDDRENNRMGESGSEEEDSTGDSCSGKADGYYQNLGSGCTSYYYCAAGYQITYVCPVGMRFNGKQCENEYNCPTTTRDGHHISNDCERKSNGYYSSRNGVGKYFYCFQQAKVIELQCDAGKVFVKDKCVLATDGEGHGQGSLKKKDTTAVVDYTDTSCNKKSNGFYQDLVSHCEKYYYCIGGEKSELRCQDGYVFNGDLCVHPARYECPIELVTSQKKEQANGNGDGDKDRGVRPSPVAPSSTGGRSIDHRSGSGTVTTNTGKLATGGGGGGGTGTRTGTNSENDYYSREERSSRIRV